MATALVLALGLTAGACGGDDGDDSGNGSSDGTSNGGGESGGEPTGGPEMPTVSDCSFEPMESTTPGALTAGYATLNGTNDTGEQVDSVLVSFELLDADDQVIGNAQSASISLWADGEAIAYQVGILGGEAGVEAYADVASCEVTEVSGGNNAEQTAFDHDAATCEVVEPEGDIGGPDAEIDVSEVSDLPEGDELFATIGIYDGDVRVGDTPVQLPPGETTGSGSVAAQGDGFTCKLLELRLP